MQRQVISISPEGVVSGLQVKPGKGFDLRRLGAASIQRASEITWDDTHQLWYVLILRGRFSGRSITASLVETEIGGSFKRYGDAGWRQGYMCGAPTPQCAEHNRLMFEEYDDAVACEIEVLDHVRLHLGANSLS